MTGHLSYPKIPRQTAYLSCILFMVIITISNVNCSNHKNKNVTVYRRELADEINAGLEVGSAIAEFFENKEFTKALTKIASSIGQYLGVIGPFVGLIMAFLPGSESAELQFMKEMMKKIDNRFDQMDVRFDELERLIKWSSMKVNLADIEHKILAMAKEFELMYEVPKEGRENRKTVFLNQYDYDYGNSGVKLYNAIIGTNGIFQENVGSAIISFTKNDRAKTQAFLSGMMKLLLQAAKIELAYYSLKNFNVNQNFMKEKWHTRILNAQKVFHRLDDEVKYNYHDQSGVDMMEFLAKYSGTSNKDFSTKLYEHLARKYYWRDWLVIAYNPVSGWEHHCVRTCGGHIKFRQNGRNLVIASRDKSSSQLNRSKAVSEINDVPTSTGIGSFDFDLLEHIHEFARYICRFINLPNACSLSVISNNADVWYKYGTNSRFVVNTKDMFFKIAAWG